MGPVPVVYVIPRMSIGGAQKHLIEVLRRLDRRRFAPALCCLATDRPGAQDLLGAVRELDVPILDARVRDGSNALIRPGTWRQVARIAGELRRRRVGVVHSYLFHANWFGTAAGRLARVPVTIVSKRNVDVYERARDRWACRLVNRAADCVTAVAGGVAEHVHRTEGCPRDKIVVIPNGIDVRDVAAAAGGATESLGIAADRQVMGTIARLVWYKGHEELLEATARVARAEPRATLVVVGDGPLRRSLERRAHDLGLNGAARFLGSVPQAWRLLPRFDIFVLPSRWEGMSNGLLEAMAAGRPIVATAVGGNPELITDGETGLLVPPQDPEALAAAMLRLIRDPALARRLGQAARRRVETDFTLEAMVRRLETLYDDLLARKRAA
jgi:glycosyltransferase involved in cell wall biosynthesis